MISNGELKIHYLCGEGIIRILHEYEGGIEKSIQRITDWHHETCRVMTNGDHEGRIFLSHPDRKNVFFLSCSPLNTSFILKKKFEKTSRILNSLRCDMVTSFNITMTSRIDVQPLCSYFFFIFP